MSTLTGIFDGKQLLLDQVIQLNEPHYVEIIIKDVVTAPEVVEARDERRKRVLSYAGIWQDIPADTWESLQEILTEQRPFFSEREVVW